MAILIIGELEKAAIASAIERARKRPAPLDVVRKHAFKQKKPNPVVKLTDRKTGFETPLKSQQVLIPVGYRVQVSFEQQPAGICMHLSISVERNDPKLMPSVEAVSKIAKEFGVDFTEINQQGMTWMEEYEPSRYAVNLLMVVTPTPEGHA
jgi:hypothetical protein